MNGYNIRDLEPYSVVIRTEPIYKDTVSSLGIPVKEIQDTSFTHDPLVFLGIANGQIYLRPLSSIMAFTFDCTNKTREVKYVPNIMNVPLYQYENDWTLFHLPEGIEWKNLQLIDPKELYPDKF